MKGEIWCSQEVGRGTWYDETRTCSRQARRFVDGRPFCWQHAEMVFRPDRRFDEEERDLAQIKAATPHSSHWESRFVRFLRVLGLQRWADSFKNHWGCSYCTCKATTSRLAVNPLTLQRSRYSLCSSPECKQKLREWEGSGSARRQRAITDWQYENGITSAYELMNEMPMQYPSLSRATLKAFLDSGQAVATVKGSGERTVAALNGSIKALGFADQVYAEVRSGEAVLRRLEEAAV